MRKPALVLSLVLLFSLGIFPSGPMTVTAAPPTTSVQDVDRPTAQPFNYHAVLKWTTGFAFANADGAQNFVVPPGKRLVIEFVSLQASVPSGGNVLFARLDFPATIVLTVTHAGIDAQSNELFTATHRVFAIVEPGTTVIPTAFCMVACTTATSSQGLIISVSGYLNDTP